MPHAAAPYPLYGKTRADYPYHGGFSEQAFREVVVKRYPRDAFTVTDKMPIPYCLEHNIGFVPFSPIASGLQSGKITTQTKFEKNDDLRNWVPQLTKENIAGNQPIIDLLTEYARKKGATCAQISLAWMLHKYPNVVPIPGSKNKERIIENLDAATVKLTTEEFTSLEAALNRCKVYGHRGFRM